MDAFLIIAMAVAVLIVALFCKGIRIVQQSEAMVIERLGNYNRTLQPGLNWIVPFMDRPRSIRMRRYKVIRGENVALMVDEIRIDRRETVFDFPGQSVMTADNVGVMITGAIYFQIADPERAVYQAENLVQAMEVLAKTSLRTEVGRLALDKLCESRQDVNDRLRLLMDEAGSTWGVRVTRVELQDLSIPGDVEEAMRKEMAAERERRAVVLRANGEREAAIARAEGEKRSKVLVAEGEREASILMAQGQRGAIREVLAAAEGSIDPQVIIGYMLGLEYLHTLPNIAKDGDRVFLPYEASSMLGAVGSIDQLLKGTVRVKPEDPA